MVLPLWCSTFRELMGVSRRSFILRVRHALLQSRQSVFDVSPLCIRSESPSLVVTRLERFVVGDTVSAARTKIKCEDNMHCLSNNGIKEMELTLLIINLTLKGLIIIHTGFVENTSNSFVEPLSAVLGDWTITL